MTRLLVALAALALFGCADDGWRAEWESDLALGAQANGQCGLRFTPDAGALDIADSGATRWSLATGCLVTTDEGGIPISTVEQAYDAEGNQVCGTTEENTIQGAEGIAVVVIEIGRTAKASCGTRERTLLHEIGHALAPGEPHTESGLMAERANGTDTIDESALTMICKQLACEAFNPEESE